MRCPYCGSLDTQVKDSRPTEDSSSIRRRRVCPDCGGRFTTFERVQLRELIVVKKSGRRVPFDRDKLMRSIEIALRKHDLPYEFPSEAKGVARKMPDFHYDPAVCSFKGWLMHVTRCRIADRFRRTLAFLTFRERGVSVEFRAARRPASYQMNIVAPDHIASSASTTEPSIR